MEEIPRDIAVQLCNENRAANRGKWYTAGGMQCLGCTTFSGGNVEKMCISNKAGYRGCNLVNKLYQQRVGK